ASVTASSTEREAAVFSREASPPTSTSRSPTCMAFPSKLLFAFSSIIDSSFSLRVLSLSLKYFMPPKSLQKVYGPTGRKRACENWRLPIAKSLLPRRGSLRESLRLLLGVLEFFARGPHGRLSYSSREVERRVIFIVATSRGGRLAQFTG